MSGLYDTFIRGAPVPAEHEADIRALLRMTVIWSALVVVGMIVNPSAGNVFILGWYAATGIISFPACLWDLRQHRD